MNNHQYVNQTSGRTEWYSPPEIIAAARQTMGDIDLDPASSAAANEAVGAAMYYYRSSYALEGGVGRLPTRSYLDWGGLSRPWAGRVFMNHPFGNPERACKSGCQKKTCRDRGWHTGTDLPGNAHWIEKVVAEYESGNVSQACVLTFAATSEAWFRPLLAYPQCFFYGRTQYIDPAAGQPAKGVTKGSCLTYLGPNLDVFVRAFAPLGAVKATVMPECDFELEDWL